MVRRGFSLVELLLTLIGALGLWGWVWDIIKLSRLSLDQFTPELIIRVVGIPVVPLGAVFGFF